MPAQVKDRLTSDRGRAESRIELAHQHEVCGLELAKRSRRRRPPSGRYRSGLSCSAARVPVPPARVAEGVVDQVADKFGPCSAARQRSPSPAGPFGPLQTRVQTSSTPPNKMPAAVKRTAFRVDPGGRGRRGGRASGPRVDQLRLGDLRLHELTGHLRTGRAMRRPAGRRLPDGCGPAEQPEHLPAAGDRAVDDEVRPGPLGDRHVLNQPAHRSKHDGPVTP
jgi:hypothetical protein